MRVHPGNLRFYYKKVQLLHNYKVYLVQSSFANLFPALVLTALMGLLQALPDAWRAWSPYDRIAVSEGEVWRIVSGNFIHLGWSHLALNAIALLIMAWLFLEDRRLRVWGVDVLLCAAAVLGGLYLFSPEIYWCVGLSGVLHGLFVIGALSWIVQGIDLGKWLLLGVTLKLLWEQIVGEMPLSGDIVGGGIVTDAHLWGALGGLIAFSVAELWRLQRARL